MLSFLSSENRLRRKIFSDIKLLFQEKQIINSFLKYPKVYFDDIKIFNWGYTIKIDISKICDYEIFETNFDFIKHFFKANYLYLDNAPGVVYIKVVNNPIDNLPYEKIKLDPYKLLIGYDKFGNEIILDMKKTPHAAIQGLSNQGKTSLINIIIRNLDKADKVLINAFDEDFEGFNIKNIKGEENILNYLDSILNFYKRKKPLYIFIDEFNSLLKNKKISEKIQEILSQGRHYNIFLVCAGQILLKENCSFKQLFNCRITFKMIDKSTINYFLGVTLEEVKLQQKEFICYSDNIYQGKTYLLQKD